MYMIGNTDISKCENIFVNAGNQLSRYGGN